MIKKMFLLLLMSVMIIPSIQAEDLPPLDTTHYFVQDNANVLSEESVRNLNDLGTHLESGTGVEMLLLTMPTTGQIHRQDYALEALRGYGVGKEDEDNGIVILLNLDNGNEFTNRGVDVQVGYGVEGYLNDAKIGRIIDQEALDYFQRAAEFENNSSQANRYYEQGLVALYEALYNESLEAFGYEDGEFTRDTPIEDSSDGSGFSSVGEIFRLFITLIFIIFVLWMIRGGGGGTGGRSRGRRGTFWGFPTGGSGGSFGGGSSGGFGGFGGGSGGGGGAGRGF